MSPTSIPFSGPGSPDHNPPQTVEGPPASGTVPPAEGENPPPGAPRPDSFSIPSALGGLGEILGDAARTVIRIPRIFANAANASAETREARALRAEWNSAAENAGVAENLATLAELLGQYEESRNDGPVLSVALTALELWGTGDADLHRELTDHRLRLSQALESGDDEAAAAAEDEALAWIPRYAAGMLRISGDECIPRELLTFLSEQPAEEIAVVDVATLALEAAFQPYHTGDGHGFLHEMTASVERGDYRLAEWSRAYLDTARHWLAWRLDGIYGREALEAGLPPADESHGDDALALTAYFSRPVADAYEAFRSEDYEGAEALFTDFRRLVRMASVTDRMNTLWDTREFTDQYNTQDDLRWNELLWFSPDADHLDQPIGPWDAAFVDSDYFERMRDFGEECFSRLGLLEGMLATLGRAETTEERAAALRETEGLQSDLEARFGSDEGFYGHLPQTVRDLVENNAARSQMSSLLETVVVSAFTFGTGAVLRNLAEAGRALPWAFRAGEMTRLGRAYSWVRDAALFEGSSLAIDAALDPGRRVSTESSTGANLARTALGYVETVGLFGCLHALGVPFQAAENRIAQGLRLASGWGERLSLNAEELVVRLSQLGTEAGGMAAYSTAFESTVGQVRGLWGDDTLSFAENAAQFFGPESLARNLALIGVMRAVGLIGETLTPRNAAALALLPLGLLDGGLSLAMAVFRGPGGLDAPFYGYDTAPGPAATDAPAAFLAVGPSGRGMFFRLDPGRSSWGIGRGPESDVRLPENLLSVSNEHATIERVTDVRTGAVRWQFIDHSTNGTVLDGVAVSGRRVTLTPGPHELVLGGAAVVRLELPGLPRPSSPPPAGWRETFEGVLPGLSAQTHEGIGYKDRNEDRFVVVPAPGGQTFSVVIDGMGGHAGGERAATIARNVLETSLRDGASLEDALRAANREVIRDNAQQDILFHAPGAVAVGVSLRPSGPDAFEAEFASVGDAEAIVLRLSGPGDPLVHRTTQWPYGEPVRRGDTLNLHTAPGANIVFSSLGGSTGPELRIDRSTATLRPGDLILSGSDGFFENFTTDEIVSILRDSGATDADRIREVLMTEAQIRMSLRNRAQRADLTLTPDLYRRAYREAAGQEPPDGWSGMYEGDVLTPQGHVLDPRTGQTVAHFKCDNVTLIAQVVGGGSALTEQGAAVPRADSTPGLLQQIRGAVRNLLLGPMWLFMGAEGGGAGRPPRPSRDGTDVVSHNLSRLSSREFRQVLGGESFGGNAGPDRAGVNVAVDAEGRIAAIGNPQNLPPEIRQALDEGRYLSVTLSVDLRGRIDWSRCAAWDPIPDAAKEALRRSVEEYNARLAAGTDGASGMLAPLLGLSAFLPGLSDTFSFSPLLAGVGIAAAVIARRAYEMSDRNRRENRMADSLVRTVHRRLRNELEMNVSLEEIRRSYHEVIAPDFKMGAGGRRNAGDLRAYSEQEEELFAYFAALSEER